MSLHAAGNSDLVIVLEIVAGDDYAVVAAVAVQLDDEAGNLERSNRRRTSFPWPAVVQQSDKVWSNVRNKSKTYLLH